jgi:hypothetical protein
VEGIGLHDSSRARAVEHDGQLHAPVATMNLPVKPGDVVKIPEEHYCYGLGALTLRLTAIFPPHPQWLDREWIFVRGVEIGWNGAEYGERQVLVRIKALKPETT